MAPSEQKETIQIAPQPGPQTEILSTRADIAFYGGGAGGGKTWALLFEAARHVDQAGYYAAIFRREIAQITIQGGLWDESAKLYPLVGAKPNTSSRKWTFPSGANVRFEGCEQESDKNKYQGAQFGFLGFDEVTHFTESQFWYLRSRVRTMAGIRPVVRATCNPDPLSWVKPLLLPWLSGRVGPGELLWYVREDDHLIETEPSAPDAFSITFIPAKVTDNQKLLVANPDYLRQLKSLPLADREALLNGSWDVVSSGMYFKPEWWKYFERTLEFVRIVRYWDLAATEVKPGKDPDYTAGVKIGITKDGTYYILDVQRVRATPLEVERLIRRMAEQDGRSVAIRIEEEGGSSGKAVTSHYARNILPGFDFKGIHKTGKKEDEARFLSAACENGLVYLPSGAPWLQMFVNELAAFPNPKVHDDQVDAASGAFNEFAAKRQIEID